MGGRGVGLDSGGGSRGASFGGLGMRAIFSPFGLVHHKPDVQPKPKGTRSPGSCLRSLRPRHGRSGGRVPVAASGFAMVPCRLPELSQLSQEPPFRISGKPHESGSKIEAACRPQLSHGAAAAACPLNCAAPRVWEGNEASRQAPRRLVPVHPTRSHLPFVRSRTEPLFTCHRLQP
jgi:hypothetical protein